MNIQLLKKLVKLANNNPNEHEANSAAKRVCRMIEDGEFNFSENAKPEFKASSLDEWIMNYGFGKKPPPPRPSSAYSPPNNSRECSECGKRCYTTNDDRYYRCLDCESKRIRQERQEKAEQQANQAYENQYNTYNSYAGQYQNPYANLLVRCTKCGEEYFALAFPSCPTCYPK